MIQFKNDFLTVFESSLHKTTTAVVETSDAIIMTDPNWLPVEVETIKRYIDQHLGNRQLYIIYTHSDFDHIIGAGAFPDAAVIASEKLADQPHKKEIMQKIKNFDERYYITRNYTPEYPSVDVAVSHDGQTLELESITLTFYLAPGHTADGIFTVIEPHGIFLSGDYLSDVEFPFIFSGYDDYVETVKKTKYIWQNHSIKIHIPGHGTATDNQPEIEKRINESDYYLTELPRDEGALEKYLSETYRHYESMKSIHADNKKMAQAAMK